MVLAVGAGSPVRGVGGSAPAEGMGRERDLSTGGRWVGTSRSLRLVAAGGPAVDGQAPGTGSLGAGAAREGNRVATGSSGPCGRARLAPVRYVHVGVSAAARFPAELPETHPHAGALVGTALRRGKGDRCRSLREALERRLLVSVEQSGVEAGVEAAVAGTNLSRRRTLGEGNRARAVRRVLDPHERSTGTRRSGSVVRDRSPGVVDV